MNFKGITGEGLKRMARLLRADDIDYTAPLAGADDIDDSDPFAQVDHSLKRKENPLPRDHHLYQEIESYLDGPDPSHAPMHDSFEATPEMLSPGDMYKQMLQRQIGKAKRAQWADTEDEQITTELIEAKIESVVASVELEVGQHIEELENLYGPEAADELKDFLVSGLGAALARWNPHIMNEMY